MRQILFFISFFLGIRLVAAIPPQEQTFDLNSALERAFSRSPILESFRRDLDIRELGRKNAFSALLPSVDLTTSHGLHTSHPTPEPSIWASQFKASLSETLYDNGFSMTNLENSKLDTEIARLEFEVQRDMLALSVASELTNYSLLLSLDEVQEKEVEILSQQFQIVEKQHRQGIKTRKEMLQFKAEQSRAQLDLKTGKANIEQSKLELCRLLGSLNECENIRFRALPVDVGLAKGIPSERPKFLRHVQFQISRLKQKRYANDTYMARRKLWPEIGLTLGLSYGADDYLGTGYSLSQADSYTAYALVSVNFNLLDWGIRRRNIEIAGRNEIKQARELDTVLDRMMKESEITLIDLRQNHESYLLSQELLNMENDSLNLLRLDYQNGKISYVDLFLGIKNLMNAKVRMFKAYFGLRNQLFRYAYYDGNLKEQLGYH